MLSKAEYGDVGDGVYVADDGADDLDDDADDETCDSVDDCEEMVHSGFATGDGDGDNVGVG